MLHRCSVYEEIQGQVDSCVAVVEDIRQINARDMCQQALSSRIDYALSPIGQLAVI